MDRIERILIRCIEEDRRERRLRREQMKARSNLESEKRIEDWLRRKRNDKKDSDNESSD
jgi:hypothetical protein